MFTFTDHAYAKINGDADLAKKIMDAARFPSVRYENGRFPGQYRHIRDGWVAVVAGNRVVTFYENVVETDLRPDQTDDDATAYAKKREARARRDKARADRRERDRALTAAMKAGNKR